MNDKTLKYTRTDGGIREKSVEEKEAETSGAPMLQKMLHEIESGRISAVIANRGTAETVTMTDKPITTIKCLCEFYDISQTELSRKYDIPLRTVQDWHAGRRTPPSYVVNMLLELLYMEAKKG